MGHITWELSWVTSLACENAAAAWKTEAELGDMDACELSNIQFNLEQNTLL